MAVPIGSAVRLCRARDGAYRRGWLLLLREVRVVWLRPVALIVLQGWCPRTVLVGFVLQVLAGG